MAATVHQVAEEAGVSVAAVLQAMGNRGRLRAETRQRIRAAATAVGYRPHASATAMRTGRYDAVTLLLSTVAGRSLLPPSLLDGVQQALREADCHLNIASIPDEQLVNRGYVPRILRVWASDGLIINYNAAIPDEMIRLIHDFALPAVWLNSRHETNCIYSDEVATTSQATRHLLSLGHRRIAFVNYVTGYSKKGWHYSTQDRFAGYSQALAEAGLKPLLIAGPESLARENQARIEFSKQWLGGPSRPTAVVCYNAETAYSVLFAAAGLGLSIPRQLSVVSFGSSRLHEIGMVLGTILVPEYELGLLGTRMLLKVIEDATHIVPPQQVRGEFHAGESCAPAPEISPIT